MSTGVVGALNDFCPLAGIGSPLRDMPEEPRYVFGGFVMQPGGLAGGMLRAVGGQITTADPPTVGFPVRGIGSLSVDCDVNQVPPLPKQFPRPAGSTSFRVFEEVFATNAAMLWAGIRGPRGKDIEVADMSKRIFSSSFLLPRTPDFPKAMFTFISEKRSGTRTPPYASLVHSLIEKDQIAAARALLSAVPNEAMDEPQLQVLRRVLTPPKVTTGKITDSDRTREYKWLQEHGHDYRDKWVAVDGGGLIAVAESLKELLEELKDLQVAPRALVHHMAE